MRISRRIYVGCVCNSINGFVFVRKLNTHKRPFRYTTTNATNVNSANSHRADYTKWSGDSRQVRYLISTYGICRQSPDYLIQDKYLGNYMNISFAVTMCYLLLGVGCGWVSPILNRFRNSDSDFSLNTEACSLIASLHYVGRGVGSVVAVKLVGHVGRSMAFVASSLICCAVWLTIFYSVAIPVHYAARVAFGLSVGLTEFTSALYIGENSSPTLRGILSSAGSILFYSAELLMFVVGAYWSYTNIALLNIALSLVTLGSMLLLREPAHHLLAKGNEALAKKRFFELRGINEASKREFEETKQQLANGLTISWHQLTDKSVRVVVILNTAVYVTGYPVINLMASLIMSSDSNLSPNEQTIVMAVILLASTLVTPVIIERFGRRPLFMTSMAISLVSHLAVVAVFVCEKCGHPLPYSAWLIFASLTTYSTIVAAIMYPVISTIRGELMSPQLKPLGGCVAIVLNSILSLVLAGVFLSIAEKWGTEMNFLIFAAFSCATLLYAYFELPETRGLTLTEIQKSLENESSTTDTEMAQKL